MKKNPPNPKKIFEMWLLSPQNHGYRSPQAEHLFTEGFKKGECYNPNFKWTNSNEKLPDVGREVVCRSMDYDPDLPSQYNYWVDVRDVCLCKWSFRDDDDLTHCRTIKWQDKTEHESEFLWSYLPHMGVQKWKNPMLQLPLNHEKVIVAFEEDGMTYWANGIFHAHDGQNPDKRNFFKVYQRESYAEAGQWREDIDVIAWCYP